MKTHGFERALEEKSMVTCAYIYIYIGGFEAENTLNGRLKNGKIPGCERAKMRLPQREDMGDHDSPFYIAHTIMVFLEKSPT